MGTDRHYIHFVSDGIHLLFIKGTMLAGNHDARHCVRLQAPDGLYWPVRSLSLVGSAAALATVGAGAVDVFAIYGPIGTCGEKLERSANHLFKPTEMGRTHVYQCPYFVLRVR